MNDPEPFDAHDPHLGERMERAVGGLHAPDVVAPAMARGRRQRTRRRLVHGAGGLAAVTAVVLTATAFVGSGSGSEEAPPSPPVAADPTTDEPSTAPGTGGPQDGDCEARTGWWSATTAQVRADLAALLPAGVVVGETDDSAPGLWGGNLVAGGDEDFASVTLLPPPGVPGGRMSLEELASGSCEDWTNEPMQAVRPCDELAGYVTCEEIRSEDGELVGVVTEKIEQTIVDGEEQPTDRSYVVATLAGPEGGHVEVYVAEGTRADRPSTVHDPADVPALTLEQVREIVSDPVWTS